MPQAPQLLGSEVRSAQLPLPQSVWPPGQLAAAHWPFWQPGWFTQTVPQAPQLLLSVLTSTQACPQTCWPFGQAAVQTPFSHASSPAQALPQAPQLSAALPRLVQALSQQTRPFEQALPQMPQLFESDVVSVQTPPQAVPPGQGLAATHLPFSHD